MILSRCWIAVKSHCFEAKSDGFFVDKKIAY
jgi:hypothetical protein